MSLPDIHQLPTLHDMLLNAECCNMMSKKECMSVLYYDQSQCMTVFGGKVLTRNPSHLTRFDL